MSKWTHSLCEKCYQELEPGSNPAKIREANTEACCKCEVVHSSGIYYRTDPNKLACKGKHD